MINIEKFKELKVLYVEDEIELRDTTCNSLISIIPDIDVASNGKEALEKFFTKKYDLIITDLSMPVMDGIEFIKRVREEDNKIVILVTTAFGSQNDEVAKLKTIGMNEYIMKPVDMIKLIDIIDKII